MFFICSGELFSTHYVKAFVTFSFVVGANRAENGDPPGGDRSATHQQEEHEERIVFVNAPHQPAKYRNNHITTAKYSLLSFIPSFLFEQFRRYSNCFFLFIALMQVDGTRKTNNFFFQVAFTDLTNYSQ